MTDRFNSLVVVLERDLRDDDAQPIIDAIKQIRGVLSVEGHVSDFDFKVAEKRAVADLEQKLWEVLHPKTEK